MCNFPQNGTAKHLLLFLNKRTRDNTAGHSFLFSVNVLRNFRKAAVLLLESHDVIKIANFSMKNTDETFSILLCLDHIKNKVINKKNTASEKILKFKKTGAFYWKYKNSK